MKAATTLDETRKCWIFETGKHGKLCRDPLCTPIVRARARQAERHKSREQQAAAAARAAAAAAASLAATAEATATQARRRLQRPGPWEGRSKVSVHDAGAAAAAATKLSALRDGCEKKGARSLPLGPVRLVGRGSFRLVRPEGHGGGVATRAKRVRAHRARGHVRAAQTSPALSPLRCTSSISRTASAVVPLNVKLPPPRPLPRLSGEPGTAAAVAAL